MTKLKNNLYGNTRYFDKYCSSYKFISIGPKRSLETNITKKAIFPVTNDFGLFFSRIVECDKPLRTKYKNQKVF